MAADIRLYTIYPDNEYLPTVIRNSDKRPGAERQSSDALSPRVAAINIA